jgi:hypothetical protein
MAKVVRKVGEHTVTAVIIRSGNVETFFAEATLSFREEADDGAVEFSRNF